uniref:Ig-like domain-containing protein n=1 Tax=Salarias fasciatus TaxID=181472 RepID=A0A672I7T9_SALFA
VGKNSSGRFLFTEPPSFPLESMEVTAGDGVCLKCSVAGTPEIKVSWFKADGKVRSSPNCKLEFSKGVSSLKLTKASKADIGEYTCKAENRIGSASSTCRVNVLGNTPSTHTQTDPTDRPIIGDSGRYFCHISNDVGKDSCSADISVKGTPAVGPPPLPRRFFE